MDPFAILSILVTISAVFAWLNHRFIGLPRTIGLMVLSLGFSLLLVLPAKFGAFSTDPIRRMLESFDLDRTLLDGMLGAMLFAGALELDIEDLRGRKYIIGSLATTGLLLSTALVGVAAWSLLPLLGVKAPLIYCLLFGALISPTDPIAVGAILKKAGIPHSLETKIRGESLFNDGVAVVVFLTLMEVAAGNTVSASGVLSLLAVEALGGLLYGALAGWILYLMLKAIDSYQVEILLTLAFVTGGYSLAQHLHVSGPLAMVVVGLLIGNRGRSFAMSQTTRERLDAFWELADEFLNALLFVVIGAEVIVISFTSGYLFAGLLAIPVVLAARYVSVAVPVSMLGTRRTFSPHVVEMLTWSGLRGGISVALALSLPDMEARPLLIAMTYIVVIFSIFAQGLTVGHVSRRLYEPGQYGAASSSEP